jgi:hypothetical protein
VDRVVAGVVGLPASAEPCEHAQPAPPQLARTARLGRVPDGFDRSVPLALKIYLDELLKILFESVEPSLEIRALDSDLAVREFQAAGAARRLARQS